MAASDQSYRNQHALDIVFAVGSTLMLASIVLMFWQDYFRPWKTEQRSFRDVEAGIAQRQALRQLPSKEEFDKLEAAVEKARKDKDQKNDEIKDIKSKMAENQPKKEHSDSVYQDKKASYDSLISFRNSYGDTFGKEAGDKKYGDEIKELAKQLAAAKAEQDKYDEELKVLQREMSKLTTPLTEAESEWKKLNDKFETQAKLAITKQWAFTDTIRDLPVLDGFAAPLKIHQLVIKDVPINFNFLYVKRFDRCMTCHQGIDRPGYTKEMLESLKNPPLPNSVYTPVEDFWNAVVAAVTPKDKPATRLAKAGWAKEILVAILATDGKSAPGGLSQYESSTVKDLTSRWGKVLEAAKQEKVSKEKIADYLTQKRKLLEAQGLLEARIKTLGPAEARNLPSPDQLTINYLPESSLTPQRIKEFCGHPRQELFVGPNSKHPAEKFGCTSCHQGQGAGTTFNGSFHSPNNSETKEAWEKEHDFGKDTHTYMWDFPMLPSRFVESSCLKCHHQVTDLYGVENRNEAPKLLKGYNLLRENGCFGCHEIQGRKGGRQVGPDLRLEANPPLEELSQAERTLIEKDVDNLPGNLRKVGPSLYRLSEKSNREWTARWLKGPRDFRPDTKMPHFYGLANNDKHALPTHEQEFPEAEIQSITHFLFGASDAYLKELAELHKDGKGASDQARLDELLAKPKPNLTVAEKAELPELKRRVRMRQAPLLEDKAKGMKGDVAAGRQLFSERGCLSCHSHKGTEADPLVKSTEITFAPKVISEAQFGPNLSQLVAKLGKPGDKDTARKWLVQWILDPHVHSPRSRMPVTHLTVQQAADVAEWLLSQKAVDLGDEWDKTVVGEPDLKKLKDLAQVYLVRLLPASAMKNLLDGKVDAAAIVDLPADEKKLAEGITSDSLKHYLGKKAVGRLGCFGCHDVPGFETAKPIGVGLMDWGKKDAERLAFEDIGSYVKEHYNIVPTLRDKDGKPEPIKVVDGKKKLPYEKFFEGAVTGHSPTREGYLNQKLVEPRSYDYNRMLAWDDRSRMPQFRFARSRVRDGETKEAFEARTWLEEAEAREAVMTFILGLVAEPVPPKSINEPTGDRLAEVKGRQVLDKFNCAGCHLVQPGVFDFKVSKPGSILLDKSFDLASFSKDHVFPNNYNWAGKTPETPSRLKSQGVGPQVKMLRRSALVQDGNLREVDRDELEEAKDDLFGVVSMRLGHALRFHSTKVRFLEERKAREQSKPSDQQDTELIEKLDKLKAKAVNEEKSLGELRDITASNYVRIPVEDMIYPPPSVFASEEVMHRRLGDLGPLGGTFSDLLLGYLVAKDKDKSTKFYQLDPQGDSNYARAAGPPSLVGQGARTQPEWLYQFLLDPQPIRRMSILRMPKFNMSPGDAEALVAYFAAVSKLQNVNTQLDYPNLVIPQQKDFDSPYWKDKNDAYLARLKEQKSPKGKSLYDERMEFLKPFLDGKVEAPLAESGKRVAAAQKALDEAKTDLDKAIKEQSLAEAKENEAGWKRADAWMQDEPGMKDAGREAKVKAWEKDAYLADSYKLVTKVCLQCHQVGKLQSENKQTQGPPLAAVFKRIRPGWAEHWIAAPPRMMPYSSVMPVNFGVDKTGQFQELLAGSSLDQVIAARDLLMVLPRIEAMPVNRFWSLSMPGLAGEKK